MPHTAIGPLTIDKHPELSHLVKVRQVARVRDRVTGADKFVPLWAWEAWRRCGGIQRADPKLAPVDRVLVLLWIEATWAIRTKIGGPACVGHLAAPPDLEAIVRLGGCWARETRWMARAWHAGKEAACLPSPI